MSNTDRFLHPIERSARRTIAHKLQQLARRILAMRPAPSLRDPTLAGAAFQPQDRHIDDRAAQSVCRRAQRPLRGPLVLDELLPLSPSDYQVRFFDREYGDLDDVIVVESFAQAVQLAVDRLACRPGDRADAGWTRGGGTLTVRTQDGSELLCIQPFDKPLPTVQALVSCACQELAGGDPTRMHELFEALCRLA
ncbi:MAG: hypothetical protein QM740_20910 [Acidovorax sp.]